ncbi:SGNH/GDSL hydrolase family protein [Pseudarthrobacter albicanus]|uniref:SGNH/GDSL hydrolase family protein n=1 Tax=Pseudarthrobacter albicanus TaxID=2823873 RepID=UPI001BAC443B|nr:SGNH/GDSL hydrolase family protein [Pseudarthrobacter albicanus]
MSTLKLRRQRSTIAAGLATLAMVLGAAAVPAEAASKTSYVALGDSYAAGQGAGPYLDACFRSENSYAELADQAKSIKLTTNAACSGNTTADIAATQLRRLKKGTELVTITAGGNDLNVGAIAVLCGAALESPACQQSLASAQNLLSTGELSSRVARLVLAVKAEAPRAKIVVTGYPHLFESAQGLPDQANQFVDALNGSIFQAASATGAQYVDVTGAFAGHGIGSGDPWINNPSVPLASDAYHPNAAGYKAYYAALKAAGVY